MSAIDVLTRELPRDRPAQGVLGLAERAWLPDWMIRLGIRLACARRLRQERAGDLEQTAARFQERLSELRDSPVALCMETANLQHYELPAELFEHVLGRRLKYSCAYYPRGDETLDQAEEAMLALYAERAELADGQDILELGCGWGSLTLWMAERYPAARITAVSNSASQRSYIEARCKERGLANVRVITHDMNRLRLEAQNYDRCISIEMFEHMRNYELLLQGIAQWLRPGGKLFVHIFVNRTLMYPFETEGEDNWLGRHFFTGGLMPAADTLLWFQRDLSIERVWHVQGTHYERTANDWLHNQDTNAHAVRNTMIDIYGVYLAGIWFQRWRIFWMACAELFGYDRGQEWFVAHYRFARGE
jgi:cyclopropane-fatty-acyl-phospholipid synthase